MSVAYFFTPGRRYWPKCLPLMSGLKIYTCVSVCLYGVDLHSLYLSTYRKCYYAHPSFFSLFYITKSDTTFF